MSILARAITEKAFTQQVLDLARLNGWRTAHFRTAMNAKGQYRTPVAGDGKGFPDLVLTRPGEGMNIADELQQAPGGSFEQTLAYLHDAAISSQAYGHDTGRIIFAELKREGAYPEPAQREWLAALAVTGLVEVYVFRPSDFPTIQEVLE